MYKNLSKLKKHDIDVKAKIDDVIVSVGALPAALDSKFSVTNSKVDAVSASVAGVGAKVGVVVSSLATHDTHCAHCQV